MPIAPTEGIFLTHGLDESGALVAVEDVGGGKTNLRCPYCQGLLVARKGRVLTAHFSHLGKTCRPVAKRLIPTIPLYDDFNLKHLGLRRRDLDLLEQMWREYGVRNWSIPGSAALQLERLIKRGLLSHNGFVRSHRGGYIFTNLGKLPLGELSLNLFSQIQEPLILSRLEELEQAAGKSGLSEADQAFAQADLTIYLAQLRRILSQQLYFLEIHLGNQVIYKLGVTARTMTERQAEIAQQLHAYSDQVSIRVLGTWERRGLCERYFKFRYRFANFPIGTLTEYFSFPSIKSVMLDLKRASRLFWVESKVF